MAGTTVKLNGLKGKLPKLNMKYYRKPIKDYFERVGIAVANEATENAAVLTNRMRSSIPKGGASNIWKPLGGDPPEGLLIGTRVTAKGFAYPKALDESSKYHYRAGPLQGQQTRGWFSGAPERAKGVIEKCRELFAKDIKQLWSK